MLICVSQTVLDDQNPEHADVLHVVKTRFREETFTRQSIFDVIMTYPDLVPIHCAITCAEQAWLTLYLCRFASFMFILRLYTILTTSPTIYSMEKLSTNEYAV